MPRQRRACEHPPGGTLHAARTGRALTLAVQIGFCARFNVDTLKAETIRNVLDAVGGRVLHLNQKMICRVEDGIAPVELLDFSEC